MKFELLNQIPTTVEEVIFMEQHAPFIQSLEEFETRLGQPFDRIPFKEKGGFILRRLNQLVAISRLNRVWRERLDSAGVVRINDWDDWHKVPISTRQDLHDHFTASKDGLVIPWREGGHKPVTSGGSTDKPVISIFRFEEFEAIGKRAGFFWRRNIFARGEDITSLNMFNVTNNWASHELVRVILQGIPNSNYFSCGRLTTPQVAEFFLDSQGVTLLAGLPSDYVDLMRMLKEQDPRCVFPQVRWISFGGDFMDPLVTSQLREMFPDAKMLNVFSSTQTNHLAVKIKPDDPFFRATDESTLIEILDDSDNPLPDGQPGRIVVTRLMGNGDQLLRLDLGDRGSIQLPDSNDPLQARKLKLYGRSGDLIRIAAGDVEVGALLSIIAELLSQKLPSGLNEVIGRQLVADNQGIHLKVAVENPTRFSLDASTQKELMIQATLGAIAGTFDEDTTENPDEWLRTVSFSIEFVKPDKLIRTPVGKIHPFINQRL